MIWITQMDRWTILFQGGRFFFLQKTLIIRMGWPVTKRTVCYDKNIFPGAVSFCNELFLTIKLNLFLNPDPLPHKEDGTPWSAAISKLVV